MANQKLFVTLALNAKQFERAAKAQTARIKTMEKSTKRLGRAFSSLKSTAIVAFAGWGLLRLNKQLLSLGASFDRSMSIVQVVTAATAKEFNMLKQRAREMGAETEFTASQAAKALRFLGMAGLSSAQAFEALPQMLDLATAGQIDLASAADLSTNILTQMGLEVKELTRVNDALVTVQASANTNIYEAASAFVYAGAQAKKFKMDVEELNALIGLLANAGIKASMAGMTLRQVMIRLQSSGAQEILKKYNIQIEAADGSLRPFVEILKELADANMGAIESTKLFGARASNITVILDKGSDTLQKYIDYIKSMGGAAARAAKIIRKDAQGALDELHATIESIGLSVWDKYGETAVGVIKNISNALRGLRQLFFATEDDEFLKSTKNIINQIELVEKTIKRLEDSPSEPLTFFGKSLLPGKEEEIERAKMQLEWLNKQLKELRDNYLKPKHTAQTSLIKDIGDESEKAAKKSREYDAGKLAELDEQIARDTIQAFRQAEEDKMSEYAAIHEKWEKEKRALKLEQNEEALDTEMESLKEWLTTKAELLQWASDNEINISVATMRRIAAIEKRKKADRIKGITDTLSNYAYFFKQMGEQSKTAFRVYQALAISEAIITGIKATLDAFEQGMKMGGPVMAAAFAVGAAAFSAAQIAQIASQSPGGGGSVSGSVGTFPSSPTTGLPDTASSPSDDESKGQVIIHIYGDSINDEEYLERWAEKISELVEDKDIRLISSHSKFADEVI